ncbi:nesprin-4 isoform X2 [Candoia aspera]|uniref:nesprin-4 isoform X2 n=1 Tax=Candoia aspera TaxID=51853 RepID=UPI002FD7B554
MQGEAVTLDLCPDEQRCHRWSGELVMPASAVCNLCTVTMEKQIREEQAWHLQKALQDCVFRFQDWLWTAEMTAASPRSSQVSYADSKKELQKFWALQKEISEKAWPLASLNRQYHQLAWMGSVRPLLRSSLQDVSWRWEELQNRVAAISRRLQHFVNQWEEFGEEKATAQVWLMELDLRLTEVEHFSGGTSLEKMIQLQAFQQDVRANAEHVDRLLVHAESLIQKSQPEDAAILEEDLKELIGFHQAVFSRVFQFQRRLVSLRLVFEDEWESDRDSDLESDCFTEGSPQFRMGDPEPAALVPGAPLCQSTPQPVLHCKQLAPGRDPLAADLEWDPSVDVGGSSSHDEDSSYCSAVLGFSQVDNLRRRCRSLCRSCGKPEEFAVQSSLQEEWELGSCSGADPMQTDIPGNFPPQEQRASQLLRKGVCCQHIKATGFDPKRIETWLDQNCRNKMGAQPEIKEGVGARLDVPPPARELQLPLRIQTRRQKFQRWPKKKVKQSFLSSQPSLEKGQRISKKTLLNSQSAEIIVSIGKECDPRRPSAISAQTQKLCRASALWLLLTAAFVALALLLARSSFLPISEPPCLQTNGFAKSFHLMLKHAGPPPT